MSQNYKTNFYSIDNQCFNSHSPYRFGFNGQACPPFWRKKDDEVAGAGNTNTAMFWEYDTRLGRRWNLDPVVKSWISSYHAFSNKPIISIDPNGNSDTDYGVKSDGTVKQIGPTNNKPDKLFAINDDNSKKNVEPITVYDKNVLLYLSVNLGYRNPLPKGGLISENSKYKSHKVDGYYNLRLAESENAEDMFKVFKFVSSNTKVEWSMGAYNINGIENIVIGTFQKNLHSPSLDDFSPNWNPENNLWNIHDHCLSGSYGASGYGLKNPQPGDLGNLKLGNPNSPHYIYDVPTNTIYRYTLKSDAINITTVKSYLSIMNKIWKK